MLKQATVNEPHEEIKKAEKDDPKIEKTDAAQKPQTISFAGFNTFSMGKKSKSKVVNKYVFSEQPDQN